MISRFDIKDIVAVLCPLFRSLYAGFPACPSACLCLKNSVSLAQENSVTWLGVSGPAEDRFGRCVMARSPVETPSERHKLTQTIHGSDFERGRLAKNVSAHWVWFGWLDCDIAQSGLATRNLERYGVTSAMIDAGLENLWPR